MNGDVRLPRILITCCGRIPSVELGFILPFSELQKQGFCIFKYKDELHLSPFDIAWCDSIFIVRGASSESVWAAEHAKRFGRMVLGWWDDDFLSIPTYSLSYSYYSSKIVKKNINTLFKLCDYFFSPSPRLAAKLSSILGKEVRVLPGAQWVERSEPIGKNRNTIPIVGFAGSQDHLAMLNTLVGPVIAAVADAHADFKVHVVGPKPDFLGKLAVETIHTPYIDNYSEYLDFASKLEWDIGLAPLRDIEFTKHKYPNKLMEYSYIGCAGVYSRVEPYASVIQDGVTGLLVENQVNLWRDAIVKLLSEPQLRLRISKSAYEFVRCNYDRQSVADRYADILVPLWKYRAEKVNGFSGINLRCSVVDKVYRRYSDYFQTLGLRRFVIAALKKPFRVLQGRLPRRKR